MLLCDYHIHTKYSFDGGKDSTADSICRAAIEKGLTHIAITDHFECNSDADGGYAPYDAENAYIEIMQAKEKYKGKLNIAYGMEIGQASQYPEIAKGLLSDFPVEFVLASLHNLCGMEDFYFMDFSDMTDERMHTLIDLYTDELFLLLSSLDKIDSLAHVTYPYRYMSRDKKSFEFSPYYEKFARLFEIMAKRDIALELNVSTYTKGYGFTMPGLDILKLFRECGGSLITIGSDSHTPSTVGSSGDYAIALAKSAGLTRALTIQNGERNIITLN